MKHVIIEGWRGINHSVAMVNQYQLIELLKMNEVSIYHQDPPYISSAWNEIDNDTGFSPTIKEKIKSIPPPEWGWYDCVYTTMHRENKPKPLADKVLTYMITEFGLEIPTDKNSFINSLCYGDNLIVAASNWVIDKLVEFGFPSEKVVLVPHGVNPQIFFPPTFEERTSMRQQVLATQDHFVFLNVGAMTWNKGVDLLLRAFAEVRKCHSNARLILKDNSKLYGFGVEGVVKQVSQDFPDLMTEEVRSSIVLLKSTLSLEQMRLLYGAADAYVSPYRAEGFNLPVIEAIACGTPAIVTAGGPTDDFCDDNTALFVNSSSIDNDAKQLAKKGFHLEPDVEHLVHHMKTSITGKFPNGTNFTAGYNQLISNYSWETCTKKLASLF